nr:MAG TPA: major capsid protein [Caudoviricetes sp.]
MEYYKKRSCACNPFVFGLPRSCTKLLNGLTTIHSLSADVSVRLLTHDLFL